MSQVLALQRAVGNRRVGSVVRPGLHQVQRQGPQQAAASPAELISKHTTLGFLDEEDLARELADGLPGNAATVNGVLDKLGSTDRDDVAFELAQAMADKLGAIPEDLRLRMIRELVSGTVTKKEEAKIDLLWDSFGWNKMVETAGQPANRELWRKSLTESEPLSNRVRKPIVDQFRWDVVGIARSYLDQNKKEVRAEGKRIGVDVTGSGAAVPEAEQQKGYADELIKMVPLVAKIRTDRDKLLDIPVGYNPMPQGRGGAATVPATFKPGAKPTFGPKGTEQRPMATYEKVNARYEEATSAIAGFANLYPSIYALLQQDRLNEVAEAKDADSAKKVIGESLTKTHKTIVTADTMLKEGDGREGEDIQYFDLVPIHNKLFDGTEEGRAPWNKPFWRDIVDVDLKEHAAWEFWKGLGVGLATAAALIAAPLTGGVTAAVLVGGALAVGTAQAAVSWEKYANLSTAGNATVRDELALVSKGQVDEALLTAIMDTLAVVLDAYGAGASAKAAGEGLGAVAKAEERLAKAAAEQAKRRAAKDAMKEGLLTGATTGLAVAAHELGDDAGPVITDSKAQVSTGRLDATPAVQQVPLQRQPAVQRQPVVQRQNGGGGAVAPPAPPAPATWGPAFEEWAAGALRRGEIPDIPAMTHVFPGQYNAQGWGIDLIGLHVDPATGAFTLTVFECKYVEPGRIAELGESAAGVRGGRKVTQGGRAWTQNAAEQLMIHSNHPEAIAARNAILEACSRVRGTPVTANEAVHLLVSAPFRALVPEGRSLERIAAQVMAMRRWKRAASFHHVPMPH